MTPKPLTQEAKDARKSFNDYLSGSVYCVMKRSHDNERDLSIKTGIPYQYVRDVFSNPKYNKKHWNAYHIYLIARAEGVPVNIFYPPSPYYTSDVDPKRFKKDFHQYSKVEKTLVAKDYYKNNYKKDPDKTDFKRFMRKLKLGMQRKE